MSRANDPNYVPQEGWDAWEAERVERARADVDRTAWQNGRTAASTDDLTDQILALEERLYVRGVLLESAAQLIEWQRQDIAFLEDLVAALVAESMPKPDLRRVA